MDNNVVRQYGRFNETNTVSFDLSEDHYIMGYIPDMKTKIEITVGLFNYNLSFFGNGSILEATTWVFTRTYLKQVDTQLENFEKKIILPIFVLINIYSNKLSFYFYENSLGNSVPILIVPSNFQPSNNEKIKIKILTNNKDTNKTGDILFPFTIFQSLTFKNKYPPVVQLTTK